AGAAAPPQCERSRRCGSDEPFEAPLAAFPSRLDRGRAPVRHREGWTRPGPSTYRLLGPGAHPAIRLRRVVYHRTAADVRLGGAGLSCATCAACEPLLL